MILLMYWLGLQYTITLIVSNVNNSSRKLTTGSWVNVQLLSFSFMHACTCMHVCVCVFVCLHEHVCARAYVCVCKRRLMMNVCIMRCLCGHGTRGKGRVRTSRLYGDNDNDIKVRD